MNFIESFLLGTVRAFTRKTQDYVIFESSNYFYDNSYELYKFVKQNYPNFKLIYVVTNKTQIEYGLNHGVSKKEMVSYKNKFKLYKYSLKAKAIFFSYDNYWKKMKLNTNCPLVYLGHGEFGVKDCSKYYNYIFGEQQNKVTIAHPTEYSANILKGHYDTFAKQNVVFAGTARNDILYKNNLSKATFFKTINIDLKEDTKIILAVCTFRNEHKENSEFFKDEFPLAFTDDELKQLNKKLSDNNELLIIKVHHAQSGVITQDQSNIKFIDNEFLNKLDVSLLDIYPLVDAMLTDFSSAYFGYLELNRPIGFINADKEKYLKNRGFTIEDVETIQPGVKILNIQQLEGFLDEIHNNIDKYEDERKDIKTKFVGDYKNNNCQSICDLFLK